MRNGLFFIREGQNQIRNELFLIRGSPPQIRNWLFLIRASQTRIRKELLLRGGSPRQIRNWAIHGVIRNGQTGGCEETSGRRRAPSEVSDIFRSVFPRSAAQLRRSGAHQGRKVHK